MKRVALFLLILLCPWLQAAEFPTRPLSMLIGFEQGGSTDIQGKVLADVLSEVIGQPVNIIYYPGAGGAVAAAMLANNQDHGYVFQFGLSLPFTFAPLVSPASYQLNSFRYVAGVTLDQPAFVTGGVQDFKTWHEFLDYARKNPGLVYATQNLQDRFIMQYIAKKEGLSLRFIPTTGGAGMAPLVLSGAAQIAFSGGTHSVYTKTGEMVVLAGLPEERLFYYPDTPSLKELGYPFSMDVIRVISVPANTPDAVVATLYEALEQVVKDPRFIEVTENVIRMPVILLDEVELKRVFDLQVEAYQRLIELSK